MFGLSFWEMAIILLVALLVIGPKKLPELAKGIGKGLRAVRSASNNLRQVVAEPLDEIRKPLEEIRQPLREIQSDLLQTMHSFETDFNREIYDIRSPEEKPTV